MATADTLTTVQYYTQFDPYYYTVDNRPLANLAANDVIIANALDYKIAVVDVTGGSTPVVNTAPTGWSVTRNSAGNYTITHGMPSANFSVQGTSRDASNPYIVYVYATTSTSISVKVVSLSNTPTDVRFACLFSGH